MDDDLQAFEAWFGRILAGMDPAKRRRATNRLGQRLRASNLVRIAQNVEPDGTPFKPRRPRKDRRGRLRSRAGGKMFKGLRYARNWKIDADEDGVTIYPATNAVDRVASVSHFGEVAVVGYLRGGAPIRARYPVRRLLGFSPEDDFLTLEVAASLLDPDAD
jgi:phage virion morphogenesis protein